MTSSRAVALRISQNQTSNEIARRCLLINIHGSESDREMADGEQLKENVLWGALLRWATVADDRLLETTRRPERCPAENFVTKMRGIKRNLSSVAAGIFQNLAINPTRTPSGEPGEMLLLPSALR